MKIIRTHQDAYDTANEIERILGNGQTVVSMNWINIKSVDGRFQVEGQSHRGNLYYKSELADFVLFPERKRWNDAVRSN